MDNLNLSVEKVLLAASLIGVTLASSVQIRATVLPDSCGSDKTKFNVTHQTGQTAPAGPAADKAQIVIIESPDIEHGCFGSTCDVTVRIGMDGAWMGAGQGKSYFAFSVTPGEHHLCANWQSAFGSLNKLVAMASVTAEAANVYYYQVKPIMHYINKPDEYDNLDMTSLNEDEGRYGVKISALSTSKPKH